MKIWQLFENFSLSELNANFAELLASINGTKATYLTANKTVYVATTGSDTTGDGTSGNPFKSINKALSIIPKNLNGFSVTVSISAGTYSEDVFVNGFTNGMLCIWLGGDITVKSFTARSCQYVLVDAIATKKITTTTTSQYCFKADNGCNLRIINIDLQLNAASNIGGFQCANFSSVITRETVTVNNSLAAISVSSESNMYIGTLAGTRNSIGIQCESGSKFSYGTKTIAATTDHTLTGGSIITNLITMP